MRIVVASLVGVATLLASAPQSLKVTGSRSRAWSLVVLVIGVWMLSTIGLPGRRLVLVLIALSSLADVSRRVHRRRRRAAVTRRAGHLLETCEALAADLRSGQSPLPALEAAAAEWSEFGPVGRAAALGADVADAIRGLASMPGAGQARVLAAAWQVAHRSGAGLAPALDLAARMLREEGAIAAVVETELAAARSTAVLLAVLPAGVLAMGTGAGGDPLGFLLDTVPGLGCLAVGLLLAHLGLAWLDAIADGVRR